MGKETKTKIYTVVSVYKEKDKRTMKIVHLTSDQIGKYFSKDQVCEFSHISILPSEKTRKIGIMSVEKMIIGSTEKIVIELKPVSFTKRFPEGTFKVFTKSKEHFGETIEDRMITEPLSLTVSETEPQTETTDTTEEPNETKVISLYNTGLTPIHSLRNNYSPIFRSNNYSMWYQLNRIA